MFFIFSYTNEILKFFPCVTALPCFLLVHCKKLKRIPLFNNLSTETVLTLAVYTFHKEDGIVGDMITRFVKAGLAQVRRMKK